MARRKYLLRIAGGHEVEAVYYPRRKTAATLCVSKPGGLHSDLFFLPYRHPETGGAT